MSEQGPRGTYPRFIDPTGFHLNITAWQRALETRTPVGDCRLCEGRMYPTPTHQAGQITWYGAECDGVNDRDEPYRHETASPNGKVLAHSSRQSEMPTGWWDRRSKHIDQVYGKGAA